MNPAIAANQQRIFLEFIRELRPHLQRDSGMPRRIKELLGRYRAIGSRDRKLYRELIYTVLRYLPWIEPFLDRDPALAARITAWLAPELKPTSHYRVALCAEWPSVPETLSEKAVFLESHIPGFKFQVPELLPSWFHEHCPAAFSSPHLDALHSRASVWVRLQCLDRAIVLDEFRNQGWAIETDPDFPDAISLPPNAEVASSDAYRRGFVEIQDLGSQMVLALAAPELVTGHWLDACAGAGGKTLQLARLLGAKGRVDATDIRREILEELRDRAERARLTNIAIIAEPSAQYDGVLVDAPCSGSGTWRRQPHLKWCVKPESIATFNQLQGEILHANASRVRPGGWLVYATCSLSHHENHGVVSGFVRDHPEFIPQMPARSTVGTYDGVGTTVLPGAKNTDGFYVAWLKRAS